MKNSLECSEVSIEGSRTVTKEFICQRIEGNEKF